MEIEKLLEEQEKQFVKKYNSSVLLAYPEYAESHMILLTDIWNWHKSSLKQFIDGLVERESEIVSSMEDYYPELRFRMGLISGKKETINYLKEIRAKME